MTDFRPPDEGPDWPESDLRRQQEERRSWLEGEPPSGAHEPEQTPEEPADSDWRMPWEAAAPPLDEPADDWPVFAPPAPGDRGAEPLERTDEDAGGDQPDAWRPDDEPAARPAEGEDRSWDVPDHASVTEGEQQGEGEPEDGGAPDEGESLSDDRARDEGPEPGAREEPAGQPALESGWGDEPEDPHQTAPEHRPEPAWEPIEPAEPEREPEPDATKEIPGALPPQVEAGRSTTALGGSDGWDPRLDGERRRPTTAEQAVPWMIGVILALAGMVIVLLALIFTFPGGLTGSASPTPTASGAPSAAESQVAVVSAAPSASDEPTPTPVPTAEPTAVPAYGPLEMVYLGRPSALAPIYLLRRDFSVDEEPTVMAQAEQGVSSYAWSPDGRVGAGIIAGRAVALEPGSSARALADDVSAISWGWDSDTLYAVRITRDGANDRTEVLQVDFASAGVQTLATITYPHPVTGPDAKLKEAQFVDDGGLVRLYAVADGNLVLWVLGAPATYRIDPGDGSVTESAGQPVLWSPDGRRRVSLSESGSTTTISLLDAGEEAVASVQVTGLVSHVRWAPSNNEIVFTLGHLSNAGGVRQDLYVWNLADGAAPMALTSDGVSFGASWVGVSPDWMPPRS